MPGHLRLLALGLLCIAIGAGVPALAAAHGNGLPWIYIEDDVIQPGVSFHVLVIDYPPHATVELEAVMGGVIAPLGALSTEADGHGEGDVVLPADFPYGHGELYGRSVDGTEAYALILVGDKSGNYGPPVPDRRTPPPTVGVASAQVWEDPSVLTLAGLLGASALLVVYMLIKRRSRPLAKATSKVGSRAGSRGRQRR